MTDTGDVNDQLRAAFRTLDERRELAERTYTALRGSDRGVRAHRAVVYRCRVRGCILLDVLSTVHGPLAYQPAYKLSPERNEATSSEAGRRANTQDGINHWKARTFFLDAAGDLQVQCDHVSVVLPMSAIEMAVGTRAGKIALP